jgi:hypothetical protein
LTGALSSASGRRRCYSAARVHGFRRVFAVAPAAAALALLAACSGCGEGDQRARAKPGAGELQTVEVEPPPDVRVDVTRDVQERRRAETFAGVLPGGFPRALPLPPQASLVDQGRGGGGARGAWIEVLVPRRPAAVRGPYLQQLAKGGWEVTPAGADAWRCRRGDTSVRLALRAQGPSTRLRFDY